MPYHISGHKPKAPAKEFRVPLWQRLLFVAIGLFLIFEGIHRQTNGPFFGHNWFNQPLYPITFIAVVVPMLGSALIPTSCFEKVAKRFVSPSD